MLRDVKSTQRAMRQLELRIIAGTLAAVVPEAAVNATDNTLTLADHGFVTGDRVQGTTGGTLPGGLSPATNYWVIKVSSSVFKLASSLANAVAGTAIDLSDDGTGAGTYTMVSKLAGPASFQASMVDQATGHWKITFDNGFANADFIAIATPNTVDQAAQIVARAATYIEVKLSDIDETAALVDGGLDILVVGSDVNEYY